MLELRNPATGEVFERIEESSPEDVATCYNRAHSAQKKWQQTSYTERVAIFKSFNEALIKKKE